MIWQDGGYRFRGGQANLRHNVLCAPAGSWSKIWSVCAWNAGELLSALYIQLQQSNFFSRSKSEPGDLKIKNGASYELGKSLMVLTRPYSKPDPSPVLLSMFKILAKSSCQSCTLNIVWWSSTDPSGIMTRFTRQHLTGLGMTNIYSWSNSLAALLRNYYAMLRNSLCTPPNWSTMKVRVCREKILYSRSSNYF